MEARLEVTLFRYANQVVLMLINIFQGDFHNRANEICIKTRSTSASHSLEGKVTRSGPPFYVVIRATRMSSRLQCELIPSFLSYFRALSNGPAPGIDPTISLSAVKRSTDWANPPAVIQLLLHQSVSFFLFHLNVIIQTMFKSFYLVKLHNKTWRTLADAV